MSETLLKIEHLTHRFGGLQALTDINVDLQKGSINGLIGPNGAGKTTVFNLVREFYVPTQGSIVFEGQKKKFTKKHGHFLTSSALQTVRLTTRRTCRTEFNGA